MREGEVFIKTVCVYIIFISKNKKFSKRFFSSFNFIPEHFIIYITNYNYYSQRKLCVRDKKKNIHTYK